MTDARETIGIGAPADSAGRVHRALIPAERLRVNISIPSSSHSSTLANRLSSLLSFRSYWTTSEERRGPTRTLETHLNACFVQEEWPGGQVCALCLSVATHIFYEHNLFRSVVR